jgi:hypothetical protein
MMCWFTAEQEQARKPFERERDVGRHQTNSNFNKNHEKTHNFQKNYEQFFDGTVLRGLTSRLR